MKKTLAALALSLCVLAGCTAPDADSVDTGGSSVTVAEDSGIAQCKKLQATAASPESQDDAAPTDAEFDQVEAAYNGSRYTDLKRAGLSHLKAVKAYYDDTVDANLTDVLVKRGALEATCKKHGVEIVRAAPSFEMPPMPPVPTDRSTK